MDCIDGNSVWQHMLTCFDPGCPDPLCQGGKAVLRHRLSCQVRSPAASSLSLHPRPALLIEQGDLWALAQLPGVSPVAYLPSSISGESFIDQVPYATCPVYRASNWHCLSPHVQDPACLLCDLICSRFKTSALPADLRPTISGAVAHDPGLCSGPASATLHYGSTTAAAPRPRSDPEPPHGRLFPSEEEDGLPSTAMVGSMGC